MINRDEFMISRMNLLEKKIKLIDGKFIKYLKDQDLVKKELDKKMDVKYINIDK